MSEEQKLISGVIIKKLEKIQTFDRNKINNGWLIDILRATDTVKSDRNNFSQIYVTTCTPGSIKGFHLHKTKTDHFSCFGGMSKWVLIDARKNSPTFGLINEFIMGDSNPMVIRIPPGVKHAFKNISDKMIYVINYMDPAFDINHPDTETTDEDIKW